MVSLNKQTMRECSARIEWSVGYRAQFEEEWAESIRYYAGDQNAQSIPVDRPITINKLKQIINAAVPQVWFQNPYVFVKPTHRGGPDDTLLYKAEAVEAVANWIWRSRKLKLEMRLVIMDSLLEGVGWIKSGYSSEMGPKDDDRLEAALAEINADPTSRLFAREGLGIDRDLTEQDLINFDMKTGHLNEFDANILRGYAWSKRVRNRDMFIDPDATSLGDAKFLVHRSRHLLRSVKRNPMFTGTQNLVADNHHEDSSGMTSMDGVEQGLPEGVRTDWRTMSTSFEVSDDADDIVDRVTLWEYWDRERMRVYTLVRQAKKEGETGWRCIRDIPWPYKRLGTNFPFKALRLSFQPGLFYGQTLLASMKEQQDELNMYRSIKADHACRHGSKVAYDASKVLPNEDQKLSMPGTGYIAVSGDPSNIFSPVAHPTISNDVYRADLEAAQSINEAVGFLGSPNSIGAPNPRVTSATEVAAMQGATQSLLEDAVSLTSDFAADVTRDHTMILAEFWGPEKWIEYTNPQVGSRWKRIDKHCFRGEFDFVIEVGATQKQSQEAKQKRAIELMNLASTPGFIQSFGPEAAKQLMIRALRAFSDFVDDPAVIFKNAMPYTLPDSQGAGGGGVGMPPGPQPMGGMPGQVDNRQAGTPGGVATALMGAMN